MKLRSLAVALAVFALTSSTFLRANDDRLKNAAAVLTEMAGMADNGIPLDLIKGAKCVVIIPSVKKAALGIGGQYGHGYINCRKAGGGWSAPGGISVKGGSVGFQIGGAATDVIMLVKNDRGAEKLLSSKFTVGADGTVAAGPVGRDASASTDIQMRAQILSYSRSRGLFAGVTLNGSTIKQDRDANERFYGTAYRTGQIVFEGMGGSPGAANNWKETLTKYAK